MRFLYNIIFLSIILAVECKRRKKGKSEKAGSKGVYVDTSSSSCVHYKCEIQYCSVSGQPLLDKKVQDRAMCLIGLANIGNDCATMTEPRPLAAGTPSTVSCSAPGVIQSATLDVWRSPNTDMQGTLALPYGKDKPEAPNEVLLSATCTSVEEVDCDAGLPVIACLQNFACLSNMT